MTEALHRKDCGCAIHRRATQSRRCLCGHTQGEHGIAGACLVVAVEKADESLSESRECGCKKFRPDVVPVDPDGAV